MSAPKKPHSAPGHAKTRRKLTHREAAEMARAYRKQGQWEKAKSLYQKALHGMKRSPRWFVELALCEIALGNYEATVDVLVKYAQVVLQSREYARCAKWVERYLDDQPGLRSVFYQRLLESEKYESVPYLGLARAQANLGKYPEAERTLVAALRAGVDDKRLTANLKTVLRLAKRMDAIEFVERQERGEIKPEVMAELLAPEDTSLRTPHWEAPVSETLGDMIGKLESELGVSPEIETSDQKLLKLIEVFLKQIEPDLKASVSLQIDLAIAFIQMELFDVAARLLDAVPKDHRLYIHSRCLLGQIFYEQGKELESLSVYQEVLREEIFTTAMELEALYKLLEIYLRLGDLDQAAQLVERIALLDSGYRDVKTYRSYIENARKTA